MSWDTDVLSYDLDGSSKGDADITKLRDGILSARKSGRCSICFGNIVPGTRIRAETAIFEGKAVTCRYCHECCEAMAAYPTVSDPMEDRYDLGRRRSVAAEPLGGGR